MTRAAALLFVLLLPPAGSRAEIRWGSFFQRWNDKSGPLAPLAGDSVRAGQLEVQLLEGGFAKNPDAGTFHPSASLKFKNLDSKRRFHHTVTIEFLDASSLRRLGEFKTFLNLRPHQSLIRLYGNQRRLSFSSPQSAPSLVLRVSYGREKSLELALPVRELAPPGPLPPEGEFVELERVADGDTLVLRGGERVRLIGVDTPELEAEEYSKTCYGKEAKAWVEAAISRRLKLSYDRQERDVYGRILAYVWLEDGRMLNEELLKSGMARYYGRFEFKLRERFMRLEEEARRAGLGLWAKC